MNRRDLLAAAAAAAVVPRALAQADTVAGPGPAFSPPRPLAPIDARADRIIDVSVCTRPFRAQGPRIEAEKIGPKTIVHNYGHGGSGWSLSWGAADVAIGLAERAAGAARTKRLAVIGCGAIGLTSAIVAQRAGFRVRIYAAERPPEVRSSNATGAWTPDSRICTAAALTPAFADRWESMARRSWWMYQRLLGLPGDPVEWREMYVLSGVPFDQPVPSFEDGEPPYPHLARDRLGDLESHTHPVAPGTHPFPVPHVRRFAQLTFNIAGYARLLIADFERAGGEIVTRTFASPREFASLPEPIVMNATGYGARALLNDPSVIPVRGQTVRLVPQSEVDYGLYWRGNNVAAIPRRDGLLVQAQAADDFGNPDVRVDRAAAVAVVEKLATLFPKVSP